MVFFSPWKKRRGFRYRKNFKRRIHVRVDRGRPGYTQTRGRFGAGPLRRHITGVRMFRHLKRNPPIRVGMDYVRRERARGVRRRDIARGMWKGYGHNLMGAAGETVGLWEPYSKMAKATATMGGMYAGGYPGAVLGFANQISKSDLDHASQALHGVLDRSKNTVGSFGTSAVYPSGVM